MRINCDKKKILGLAKEFQEESKNAHIKQYLNLFALDFEKFETDTGFHNMLTVLARIGTDTTDISGQGFALHEIPCSYVYCFSRQCNDKRECFDVYIVDGEPFVGYLDADGTKNFADSIATAISNFHDFDNE